MRASKCKGKGIWMGACASVRANCVPNWQMDSQKRCKDKSS